MDILTILISGIAGIGGGFGVAKVLEKKNVSNLIKNAKKAYPYVTVFANTLREVLSVNEHLWGAIVYENDTFHVENMRKIVVLDRIGGGDGFVGGLLYSILKEWEPEKWVQFAWASGALATTFLTDYAQPADEDMIWSIWKGNARVKR